MTQASALSKLTLESYSLLKNDDCSTQNPAGVRFAGPVKTYFLAKNRMYSVSSMAARLLNNIDDLDDPNRTLWQDAIQNGNDMDANSSLVI